MDTSTQAHKPRLDTPVAFRQNVIIMTDHPFPYSMIQRMERRHGFKVTEEDMDAVVGLFNNTGMRWPIGNIQPAMSLRKKKRRP